VTGILESERAIMSWIDVGEVDSTLRRRSGWRRAGVVGGELRSGLTLDLATPQRVLEAAASKARHRLSSADAFAVATSRAHGATLATGDPEILLADPTWDTEDLRPT